MDIAATIWLSAALLLALYAALVLALYAGGRRESARAVGGFIPDCVVLVRRLLGDPRVPRRRKVVLVVVVGYLALPFDLVPDLIPVAGQLDDAVILALALRFVLRGAAPELLRELWPGPARSLDVVERLAGRRRVPG
jgi:uncharacterized membrane protein YkvA (DUF1232 family)